MSSSTGIRCHYDVLGVDQSADQATIKKAHRKLAIRLHPDKFRGSEEEAAAAAEEFRLVQEAYECLSDPSERAWYNEHRESILAGIKPGEGGNSAAPSFVVEVAGIFYHPSAYGNSYRDDEGCFYQVYRDLFERIDVGELKGWIAEGNIDDHHAPRPSFGSDRTEWKSVNNFYKSWENYQTCLNFAWVDEYDIREAPNRRYKRAMDEENTKLRRKARKERNDEILSLLHFVKRRDPRVKRRQNEVEQQKLQKKRQQKLDTERKKQEVAAARKAWREEQETYLAEMEAKDLDAGRIRLADLEDDDYEYSGKKGKRRGKKGKKKKKEQVVEEVSIDLPENLSVDEMGDGNIDVCEEENPINDNNVNDTCIEATNSILNKNVEDEQDNGDEDEYVESESSEEPDIWRCEACRKDFKSQNQMDNHLKSKKHKEKWKKYEKQMKQKLEENELYDLMNQMDK